MTEPRRFSPSPRPEGATPVATASVVAGSRARRFDWDNLIVRVASGAVLAAAALTAVFLYDRGSFAARAPFLLLMAIGSAELAREWTAMAVSRRAFVVTAVVALAVLTVLALAATGHYVTAWGFVAIGALAAAAVARGAADRAVDAAFGVFYIAPACLVIVWLIGTRQGSGWTLMLFATTWAADIGAYLTGASLGGPRLWPRYSPNKTWSGLVGGLACAVLAAVGVAAVRMHLSLAGAALIGLAGGLSTMAGDLWELMLKRRFGVKDAGDLIPGHGGLLDKVDGLMFATIVFGAARLIDSWGWAH